jgi:hypothetical protein
MNEEPSTSAALDIASALLDVATATFRERIALTQLIATLTCTAT